MHLYETKIGDRWVCKYCAKDEKEMIEREGWEHIFDRDEQDLICHLCNKPEFSADD